MWIAVLGCKSPGTITLDFDVDGSNCASFGSAATHVLFAEPRIACSACACGGCVGADPGGVVACPTANKSCGDVRGSELALTPGVWAVVLQAFDASEPPVLVGSQCLDVTVDADGTSSTTLGGDDGTNCAACVQ